jgi:hypothetical protein
MVTYNTVSTIADCCLQVVIMFTPISIFFNVDYQNWQEWLFAIAMGAGSLVAAFLTKVVVR